MGGLSIWHWLIVLAVVLLLFGTGRVGNLMGELGKGMKAFKNNIADDQSAKDASMLEQQTRAPEANAGQKAGQSKV
jgi:sec-independent protein translocase protein TatA